MRLIALFSMLAFVGAACAEPDAAPAWRELPLGPPPAANPLRGFVPYQGEYAQPEALPHSLEYNYVGFADIAVAPDTFDFERALEPMLDDIASRGHQAIVRVFLDYPDEATSIPQWLVDGGLKLRAYEDHGGGKSPDYAHEPLVSTLEQFVAAFGARYDGDARLGCVQVGLLGHWGEWHTWPDDDLFAPVATQRRIVAAYERAFRKTHVLISQDALGQAIARELGATRLGFHDDNFCVGTLDSEDWRFHARLKAFVYDARWRRFPVGGEVQPDIQRELFDVPSGAPEDFAACVVATRPSWLLYHEAFVNDWPAAKRQRALDASLLLGYVLSATHVAIGDGPTGATVRVRVVNRGAAPFPYSWPVELQTRDASGGLLTTSLTEWDITAIQPSHAPVELTHTMPPGSAGRLFLVVRNALDGGPNVRLANLDDSGDGLFLGTIP